MRAWTQSIAAALLVVLIATLATVTTNGGATGADSVRMAQATRGSSADAAPTRPNLVFVLTDDMRDDDLDHMPITRRLLADQGMEFTDAISPHPLCCPARAELATGYYAQSNGVLHNSGERGGYQALTPGLTYAPWLQESGYRTAFVGKFLNKYSHTAPREPGWDVWSAQVDKV